jgi:hypothetical protein
MHRPRLPPAALRSTDLIFVETRNRVDRAKQHQRSHPLIDFRPDVARSCAADL